MTADAIVTIRTTAALIPKYIHPITAAGSKAAMTAAITFVVDRLVTLCGDGETLSPFKFIQSFLSELFFHRTRDKSLCKLIYFSQRSVCGAGI